MAVALSVACEASAPADAGRLLVPVSLSLHNQCCSGPSLSLLIPSAKVLPRSREADALAGSRTSLSIPEPEPKCSSEPKNPFSAVAAAYRGVAVPMDCQVHERGACWCPSSYMPNNLQMQHCMKLQTCPSMLKVMQLR